MTAIIVCPLSRLSVTVAKTGARHVVTLMGQGGDVPSFAEREGVDHLFLAFNDICEPMDGMICPTEEHVRDLLGFVARWDRKAPVVIHCFAGISRSTAGAYMAMCALRPDLDEDMLAQRLRERSPEATPNARLIALADEILGREGRMARAIASLGRGREAFEGSVFSLPVDD
jgi:predicted protein tyrosine phosphatase